MSSNTSDVISFYYVVYSLTGLYIAVGVLAFVQFCRLLLREKEDEGSFPGSVLCTVFWPSTVQQQVHVVIFVFAAVRTAFFFVAIDAWDPTTGEVIGDKVAFYTLDSFATVIFFTLASVLALFWAELYYISKNEEEEFHFVIKPLTHTVIVLAYVGVAICSYVVSTDYEDDIDYVFLQYTILSATVYFIAAVMFAYYAQAAAAEIKQVPIHLSARKSRLRLLRILAVIIIVALITKASILIAVTGENLPTISDEGLSLLFFYYFFLELFPIAVVLVFYRVESRGEDLLDDEDKSVSSGDACETEPLTRSGHQQGGSGNLSGFASNSFGAGGGGATKSALTGAAAAAAIRRGLRPSLPKFGRPTTSTPDVVDAIIARLSSVDSRDKDRGNSSDWTKKSDGEGSRSGSIASPASSTNSFTKFGGGTNPRTSTDAPPGPLNLDGKSQSLNELSKEDKKAAENLDGWSS